MTLQRRSYSSLPSFIQTNRNNLELAVTDDILFEPEQAKFVSGFIGDTSKLSAETLKRNPLLVEDTAIRQKYQFSIAVAQLNPDTQRFVSGAFYDDLLNHLSLNGAIINDPNRLFSASFYAWTPPIDYDKIINPARYVWTGNGTGAANGEYVTKEAAGSQTTLHQFDGTTLNPIAVTVVAGLPISGSLNEIVEDVSTNDRLLYQWNGAAWGLINFLIAADTTNTAPFVANDFVYVCRTGANFNRPVVWVYRPNIGRWISIPVVININQPEQPQIGMIWEDARVPPVRVLRIWDGVQWQILDTGTTDPVSGQSIIYTRATGPSGIPANVTYLFDTRSLAQVDTWSAQNWWRVLADLSLSDQGNLSNKSQGSRPIIEFWGNIESAAGDIRTTRDQFPLFNLYAVSPTSFEIVDINPTNFPGLDTAALTTSGNYVGGSVAATIFQYARGIGAADAVLGFAYKVGSDGTPLFKLTLESLPITIGGSALSGYRYFRDIATGYVHSIWERTDQLLTQTADTNGLFEIPKNLKFNPDHIVTTDVSRSSYINHFASVMRAQTDFSGTPFGVNNYRYTEKNLTLSATMIDPEESLLRIMAVLQTNKLDLPDAIRQMSRDYNKVLARFLNQLNTYWNNGTISTVNDTLSVTTTQAVDAILSQIFLNRSSEFPYFYSSMGTYVETRIINGVVDIFDASPLSIFIPNSSVHIGASPPYTPEKFLDDDGITKIRGHDGSLIPAYGDARDDVILDLENRFFTAVPSYMKTETTTFSGRFSSAFHLDDYYGNFIPNLTAGHVVQIIADYTTIISPVTNDRLYSSNQQVYATWDGFRWVTQSAQINDVFQNQADTNYYIFNGFYAKQIVTFNRAFAFDYSENEYRAIIQREFERWLVVHDLDFTTNNEFDENDPFTWNFSSAGVEGNWRGLYRRLYRTIRPHSHPWEVVGYSVRPNWWLTSYVPTSFAPDGSPRYANSHAMWTDLQAGIVNPLSGLTFASHAMVAPIPVDVSGNLLDPISANIIDEQALTPSSLSDDWAYGDGGPVEQKFYDSYYLQFANALAGYLMKPALFVDRTWSEFYRQIGDTGANLLWNGPHLVFNTTLDRPQAINEPAHLSLDASGDVIVNPGLNSWIAEYTNIIGLSANLDFNESVKNAQAVLGWKTSGFVNAKRTRIELLNGDEVPSEDINVVLHQGPSINEYFQSGIIIVRDTDGFRVFGTDVLNPFFTVDVGAQPIVGGTIETTQGFVVDGLKIHPKDDLSVSYARSLITVTDLTIPPITNDTAVFAVLINGFRVPDKYIQRIDATHFSIDPVIKLVSGDQIVVSVVTTVSNPSTQLGSFTINGTQVTYFATGTGKLVNYPYGSLFRTLSDVVNMMIGHGRFLSSQGWVFERLTNGQLRDWLGAAQTFVLWSTNLTAKFRGNPSLMKGQIFQFSVMGRKAEFSAPFGMILGIEDMRNGSYGVVDVNGKPIRQNHLEVLATGGDITVTSDTTDIFGLRLYLAEVQHVVFFPNTTTFNDVIYEPAFGLAQDAVIVDTYRTTNWTGRLEAPGFLISGGQIAPLSIGATAATPDGMLFPNWEKQVNDVTRFYNRFNPPDDPVLTGMARALFGYAPQNYLQELAIDDRNQFNFFHGSLKSKGTFQPYQAFIRGTMVGTSGVQISEDWAWKFARYGDRRKVTVLFGVDGRDFVDVFQAVHFDSIAFSYSFTGDSATTCFEVPRRFDPRAVVVTVDGVLQIFGLDYEMQPSADGYEVCFTSSPNSNAVIIACLNQPSVHAIGTPFYNPMAAAPSITLPDTIVASNIIFSSNGLLGRAGADYTLDFRTISYTAGTTAYGLALVNPGGNIFSQIVYNGDGFTTEFNTSLQNQSLDTVIVALNGVVKTPGVDYTIDTVSKAPIDLVALNFTPGLTDVLLILAITNPLLARSKYTAFTATGSQTIFTIPGVVLTSYRDVVVTVNGLVQVGPVPGQIVPNTYQVVSGSVVFNTPPSFGAIVNVFSILDAAADRLIPLQDDRVIYIPQFTPPVDDGRWVIPPQQDIYRDQPYHFPLDRNGRVDFGKYQFTASLVDQSAVSPAVTLFHWDPARDLHEPFALSMVDYKIPYDPARYNNGPLAEGANGLVWGETQIGQVWWDTSVILYSDYEGYLPDYMRVTREWGKLKYFKAQIVRVNDIVTVTTIDPKTGAIAPHDLVNGQSVLISGADQPTYNGTFSVTLASSSTFTFTVDIAADTPGTGNIIVQIGLLNCYEWVASPVPPSAWETFVNSQPKSSFNLYSGTVRNVASPSYATREIWDVNGNSTTTYYFWVQSNTRTISGKEISVNDIAGRLRNPAQYEVPFFAVIDPATMFVFSGDTVVLDDYAVEITYYWYEMPRHIEWILFGENDDFTPVPVLVTDKLIDSMLGEDIHSNPVPNVTLALDEKYGSCFFPAQTVFQDVGAALDIYVDAVNTLLVGIDINTVPDLFNLISVGDEKTSANPDGYWSKTTWWDPTIDHAVIYDTVIDFVELNFLTAQGFYAAGDIVKVLTTSFNDPWFTDESMFIVTHTLTGVSASTSVGHLKVAGQVTFLGQSVISGVGKLHVGGVNLNSTVSLRGLAAISQVGEFVVQKPVQSFVPAYYQYDGTSWNLVGIINHTFEINANIVSHIQIFRDFFSLLTQNVTKIQTNRVLFAVLFEMLRQNPNCDWFFKTSYIDLHVTQEIPVDPFVFPDQAALIKQAVLNLKPFRTKLRDETVSYTASRDDINVNIAETEIDRITLIFDRVACNLNDENAWDTIPWDATVTYPENLGITIPFTGTGLQRCFTLPEAVPSSDIVVFLNGVVAIPVIDWTFDPGTFEICFTVIPVLGDAISVVIDSPYQYIADVEYSFRGNGSVNAEVLPTRVGQTNTGNVFSNWNGVHQIPTTDFVINVTSDVEVVYNVTPSSEIEVNGTVFGGVIDDIFVQTAYAGDGVTQIFNTTVENQTLDTIAVFINGVWQTPGVDYTIDDLTHAPNSSVSFVAAPAASTSIVIYAVAHPDLLSTRTFVYIGNGTETHFAVTGINLSVPPMIFANIDGIQQNPDIGDYLVDATGITFTNIPSAGAKIAIFIVHFGVGQRLAPSIFPQTIQWDWAFWNYADLGRQEYDFAALFLGDGVTDSFTLPIPQQSSLLYNVIVKFFKNGVLTTLLGLGLTMTVTKLSTGVVVFLSNPLPSDTYGAVYVSRGLFDGLEPSFGFQDPNGIVFAPTPSSYQHFFARLISDTFDPSTVEVGCPNSSPEERIPTFVDDSWVIAVKIYTETAPELVPTLFSGTALATAHVGTFGFAITTTPLLTGVQVTAIAAGMHPAVYLVGLQATSAVGVLATSGLVGDAATAQVGVLTVTIDTNPSLSGVQATSVVGSFVPRIEFTLTGNEVTAQISSPILSFVERGFQANTEIGAFSFEIDPSMPGQQVSAQAGRFVPPQTGQEATALTGILTVSTGF